MNPLNPKLDRRHFLKQMAASACAHPFVMAGLSPALLTAYNAMADVQADSSARFVLIRVHGAMDSSLGLHPYTKSISGINTQDLFLGYDPEKDIVRPEATNIELGPSAASISGFASKMAIVRGIFVGPNDLGHPFAIQHMTAGRTQESAPFWTSYIGSQYSTKASGSYVVTNTALQRGPLAPFPTLLTSVLRSQVAALGPAQASGLSLYKDSSLGVSGYLDFQNQSAKLGKFMEVFERSTKDGAKISDEDLVIASLYSGIARVAQLDMDTGREDFKTLDTHVSHASQHPDAQKSRWEKIAKFLGQLEELNLASQTLVVVITEFNRTPGLNVNGGKDHNYSDNAVALFGRGVNGGTTIGDHKLFTPADGFPYAYWAGSHIDFGTPGSPGSGKVVEVHKGEDVSAGVDLVHPGDVWKTIAASLNAKLLKKAPEASRLIPGLFV